MISKWNSLDHLQNKQIYPSSHIHHVQFISIWMQYIAAMTYTSSLTPLIVLGYFHWNTYSHVNALNTSSHLIWPVNLSFFHAEEVQFRYFPNPFVRFILHHLNMTFLKSSISSSTPMPCKPRPFHSTIILSLCYHPLLVYLTLGSLFFSLFYPYLTLLLILSYFYGVILRCSPGDFFRPLFHIIATIILYDGLKCLI